MELPTLKFDVYHADKKTGRIEIENGKLVKKECYVEGDMVYRCLRFPFLNMENGYSVLKFLQTRVFPYERDDREILLKSIGLSEYNVYESLRKTHGVDVDDYWWFKFDEEGEVKFKEIHPRGAAYEELCSRK